MMGRPPPPPPTLRPAVCSAGATSICSRRERERAPFGGSALLYKGWRRSKLCLSCSVCSVCVWQPGAKTTFTESSRRRQPVVFCGCRRAMSRRVVVRDTVLWVCGLVRFLLALEKVGAPFFSLAPQFHAHRWAARPRFSLQLPTRSCTLAAFTRASYRSTFSRKGAAPGLRRGRVSPPTLLTDGWCVFAGLVRLSSVRRSVRQSRAIDEVCVSRLLSQLAVCMLPPLACRVFVIFVATEQTTPRSRPRI